MKIRMPATRAYYPASGNERERLLVWIPPHDLEQMATRGGIQADILEDYPSGLEVRVSRQGFEEFGLDLGVDPEDLCAAYLALLDRPGALPESGIVDGRQLERLAAQAEADEEDFGIDIVPKGLGEPLTEPQWTDGTDPLTVMQEL